MTAMKYNFNDFLANAQARLERYNTLEIADTILDISARIYALPDNANNTEAKNTILNFFNIALNGGERVDSANFQNNKNTPIKKLFRYLHPGLALQLKDRLQLNDQEADELFGSEAPDSNGIKFAKLHYASGFLSNLFKGRRDEQLDFDDVETFDILRLAFRAIKDRQDNAARQAAADETARQATRQAAADSSFTVDKLLEELSKATTTAEKSTILFRNKQYFKDLSAQQQKDIAPAVGETISGELISALTDIQAKNIACIKATNIELSRR